MRRVSPRWRAIDLACWSVMPRQALSSDSPFVGRIRSLVASPPCGTCCFVPNICSSLPSWVGRLCVDRTIPQGEHRCCFYVWRWRRVAPAHEGPRNEPSNKAHEPTSGRSTHYGSGHLIRVFRDIGHIFSSLPIVGRFRCLVALPPHRDLLLCAKHLIIAATCQLMAPDLRERHHTCLASRISMASTYGSLRQRRALRSASARLPAHSARL